MARPPFVPSENGSTWDTINTRLGKFSPAIDLKDFVDLSAERPLKLHKYTSVGLDFQVSRSQRSELLKALKKARTPQNKQGFLAGRWEGAMHAAKGAGRDLLSGGSRDKESWVNNISLLVTKGDGFREIWYFDVTERQLRLKNLYPVDSDRPKLDPKFSAMFKARNATLDLSSLHFGIEDPDADNEGRSKCQVHIDQVGIIADLGGTAALIPDCGYHTFVELAYRTGLKGILPGDMLQLVDFIMPSSSENFALDFGLQLKVERKDLQLTVRAMCGVDRCRKYSIAVNLAGTFSAGGG